MSDGGSSGNSIAAPVIAGLAVGIAFVMVFLMIFSSTGNNSSSSFEIATMTTTIPTHHTITPPRAVEIATQDVTSRYIKNPQDIKVYTIVGHEDALYVSVRNFTNNKEEGGKWTLQPLVYVHPNGTFYLINATTQAISQCQLLDYCPLPSPATKNIKGRLGWIIQPVSRCRIPPDDGGYDVMYVIDANTGKIIWRYDAILGIKPPTQIAICK